MVPRIQLLIGVVVFAALGLALVLIGFGRIAVPPEHLEAPLWVVSLAGLVFLCGAGLMLLVATTKSQPSAGLPLAWRLVALVAATAVSVIAGWVAFGDGPREFTGSSSGFGVSRGGAVGEEEGRFAFGILTVLSGIVVVAGLFQAWFDARRSSKR